MSHPREDNSFAQLHRSYTQHLLCTLEPAETAQSWDRAFIALTGTQGEEVSGRQVRIS